MIVARVKTTFNNIFAVNVLWLDAVYRGYCLLIIYDNAIYIHLKYTVVINLSYIINNSGSQLSRTSDINGNM